MAGALVLALAKVRLATTACEHVKVITYNVNSIFSSRRSETVGKFAWGHRDAMKKHKKEISVRLSCGMRRQY